MICLKEACFFMQMAIDVARKAGLEGFVPIACTLVWTIDEKGHFAQQDYIEAHSNVQKTTSKIVSVHQNNSSSKNYRLVKNIEDKNNVQQYHLREVRKNKNIESSEDILLNNINAIDNLQKDINVINDTKKNYTGFIDNNSFAFSKEYKYIDCQVSNWDGHSNCMDLLHTFSIINQLNQSGSSTIYYKTFYNGNNNIDHCELKAINYGNTNNINWKKAIIYITCEPCPMCFTALSFTRIKKIVFGCYNLKFGCLGGKINLLNEDLAIYKPEVIGGIMENDCAAILRKFFNEKR